jgi:hypothetical protein
MKSFLPTTKENRFQFYLIFNWKHGAFYWVYIKLNIEFEIFWNHKSNEQILLNFTNQYGVQIPFLL